MKFYSFFLFLLILLSSYSSYAQNQQWSLHACIDTALKNRLSGDNHSNAKDKKSSTSFENNTLPNFQYNGSGTMVGSSFGSADNFRSELNEALQESEDSELKEASGGEEKRITLNVLNAYLKVLFDLEQIESANKNIEIFQQLIHHAETLEKSGRQQEAALLKEEIKNDADRFSIFSLICELSIDQIALMEEMNIPLILDLELEKIKSESYETSGSDISKDGWIGQNEMPELRKVLINREVARSKFSGLKKQLELAEQSFQKIQKKVASNTVSTMELRMEKNNYLRIQSELLKAKYELISTQGLLEFYQKGIISI